MTLDSKVLVAKKKQKHLLFANFFSVNKHTIVAGFEANPSIFTAEIGIAGKRGEALEKQRHLTRSVPRNQNKSFIVN